MLGGGQTAQSFLGDFLPFPNYSSPDCKVFFTLGETIDGSLHSCGEYQLHRERESLKNPPRYLHSKAVADSQGLIKLKLASTAGNVTHT